MSSGGIGWAGVNKVEGGGCGDRFVGWVEGSGYGDWGNDGLTGQPISGGCDRWGYEWWRRGRS